MPDFDTSHLLDLLRQHTSIPAAPGYDDEDCLRLLTATLHGYMVPLIKAQWQEHNLGGEAATFTTALVEGQREYVLPSRAIGASIRKAVLTGPNGARTPLRLLEVDWLEEQGTANQQCGPVGYVVRGGRMYLHPAPTNVAGWSLRVAFLIRPARLVVPTACGFVTGLNVDIGASVSVELNLEVLGTSGTVSVDVVRGTPPFEAMALEVEATLLNDGLTATIPHAVLPAEGLRVGDVLCVPGTSPFVQCPVELLDLLAARVAVEQIASLGDASVSQAKAASLQERRSDAMTITAPRTGEARTQGNGMRKWRGFGNGWRG